MKNKRVVIVGASLNARLARSYFETDSEYEVAAFAVHRKYIGETVFEGLPVIAPEDIMSAYPPSGFETFVAAGYNQMNKIREKLYTECKNMGYKMAGYISSRCTFLSQFPPGDNCFIPEDNTIQSFVKIGNNAVLWSGNHIGDGVTVEDHCYVTSHVVISGFVHIKRNCFLGVNASLRDGITIAPETLIGAGAVIMKDTIEKGVYMLPRSVLIEKKSDEIVIS